MIFLKTLIPFFATLICMAFQPALSSASGVGGLNLLGGGLQSLIIQLIVLAITAGVVRFFASGTIIARVALPALGIIAIIVVVRFLKALI